MYAALRRLLTSEDHAAQCRHRVLIAANATLTLLHLMIVAFHGWRHDRGGECAVAPPARDVFLALLAKEPLARYQLRARLQDALGPLGETLNAGQVYVTPARLEKAGLVTGELVGQADRPDRKVYALTAAGQERVSDWLTEVSWPKPAPAEFHLKLVAAAAAGLADPVGIVDAQRRELLRGPRAAQRAALAEPDGSDARLLLEGVVLRYQADPRWLEACARHWTVRKG